MAANPVTAAPAGNHGDCLPQFPAASPSPISKVDAQIDEAEEDDRAAYVGDGLRGEPDEFFQCPSPSSPFLPVSRMRGATR